MGKKVTREVAIPEIMQSLRRIFRAIQDYYLEVSNRFGITGPQLWALKNISKSEKLPIGKLANQMYLHPSTITGVIDRLEKKGYVSRDRNQGDRRVTYVQLTPQGKRLVRRAPNPVQGKMIFGLRKLKKDKLNSIHESLNKLVEIMEARHIRATFFFDQE